MIASSFINCSAYLIWCSSLSFVSKSNYSLVDLNFICKITNSFKESIFIIDLIFRQMNNFSLNGNILKPVSYNLFWNHFNNSVLIFSRYKISNMFNLIIISIVFFYRNFDSFLDIIHVSMEMWNVLNISYRLWNI